MVRTNGCISSENTTNIRNFAILSKTVPTSLENFLIVHNDVTTKKKSSTNSVSFNTLKKRHFMCMQSSHVCHTNLSFLSDQLWTLNFVWTYQSYWCAKFWIKKGISVLVFRICKISNICGVYTWVGHIQDMIMFPSFIQQSCKKELVYSGQC